jgi:hypothetical protein
MERLEREPAKKPGYASSINTQVVFWAVVDVHGHYEDSNIGNHKHRNQPRSPFAIRAINIVIAGRAVGPSALSPSSLQISASHCLSLSETLFVDVGCYAILWESKVSECLYIFWREQVLIISNNNE